MSHRDLIPLPRHLEDRPGRFTLEADARICWSGSAAREAAELLAEYLRPATGFGLGVEPLSGDAERGIVLAAGEATEDTAGFVSERYVCDVSPNLVRLEADSGAGLVRAVQTLRQLLSPQIYADTPQTLQWAIDAVRIEDEPRFRWRGLHLDVSRHFFSVAEVCRFIELTAIHRMNVCHLHLSDDQGWRVQINQYPRLTEVASIRPRTLIGHESTRPRRYDDEPYGGFYTQADIRQIVEFARRRQIMLVPEIDMPGHCQAVIAAYPELGNTSQMLEPRCHWGISQHVLNVEDSTVRFMQNVLDEVMDLFPGRFIHVGGDEAPKQEWSESPAAQRRMAERGLRNEQELQSWFILQMVRHITSRGRRLIGWDEILEGGLAEGAAVMSWRGEQGGIEAARHGHDVVMAPNQWTYFDHYQAEPVSEEPLAIGGMLPLGRVYAFEPIPKDLPAECHGRVLGGQGQLWTEYIATMSHLEYMAYPRACALAEILWLPREQKCYRDFASRLSRHQTRLEVMGVNASRRT